MLARGTQKIQCSSFLVNPSEVVTNFYHTAGCRRKPNATKTPRAEDIAYTVKAVLEMDDRALHRIYPSSPRIHRINAH